MMARFSSRKPHHCSLLTNTNSTVPVYADEFVFVKYTYLLSKSTLRVEVSRHAERACQEAGSSLTYVISIDIPSRHGEVWRWQNPPRRTLFRYSLCFL